MLKRYLLVLLAFALATSAVAQGKKRIDKAADMPRFTYKVEGKLEDLVRDEKAFSRFAGRGAARQPVRARRLRDRRQGRASRPSRRAGADRLPRGPATPTPLKRVRGDPRAARRSPPTS
ncbi:MAG: hypothetical protein MZV65_29665 [Chromatiales bacterium]|nr:hypothetical protein [Chromatiales bacterium]